MNDQRELYINKTQEEVEDEVVDLLIENDASVLWVEEFYNYRIFMGVRTLEDHKVKVFDSIEEVEDLPNELVQHFSTGFERLEVGNSTDVKS